MNRKTLVCITLGGGTLAAIVWGWLLGASEYPTSSAGVSMPAPPVPAIDVGSIVGRTANAWRDAGIQQKDIELLQVAAQALLTSWVRGEFGVYNDMMTTAGGELGTRAQAVASKQLRSSRFPTEEANRAEQLGVEGQLSALWRHPESRLAEWESVDETKVRVGVEWLVPSAQMAEGVRGSFTMYEFEGHTLLQRAQSGALAVAWVEMPVVFAEGRQGIVRINFVVDRERHRAVPLRAEVIGAAYPQPTLLF